jgi:hypothetical protein
LRSDSLLKYPILSLLLRYKTWEKIDSPFWFMSFRIAYVSKSVCIQKSFGTFITQIEG